VVTHRGLLEVHHFGNGTQRAQRRRIQVIADGNQRPRQRLNSPPSFPVTSCLIIASIKPVISRLVPAAALAARIDQLDESTDGVPALSSTCHLPWLLGVFLVEQKLDLPEGLSSLGDQTATELLQNVQSAGNFIARHCARLQRRQSRRQ
jgi:hypothetical protein